jgi:hypothetical protein
LHPSKAAMPRKRGMALRYAVPTVNDPLSLEWVAAEERLKCYRIYCSDVPQTATPMLTREYMERIRRKEPTARKLVPTCQTCGMLLPNSGQCDFCE